MFRFLMLIVPLILSACNNSESELKKLAMSSIEEKLKDPDSAKFSDVFLPKGDQGAVSVCGYVNTKNSFGGYSGKVRFLVYIYINQENNKKTVYLSKLDDARQTTPSSIDVKNPTVFDTAWKVFCTNEKSDDPNAPEKAT